MSCHSVSKKCPARTSRVCSFTCSTPPLSIFASRCARRASTPPRIFSCASISTYPRTSSSSSALTFRLFVQFFSAFFSHITRLLRSQRHARLHARSPPRRRRARHSHEQQQENRCSRKCQRVKG